MARIAVEEGLKVIGDYLKHNGYEVVPLNPQIRGGDVGGRGVPGSPGAGEAGAVTAPRFLCGHRTILTKTQRIFGAPRLLFCRESVLYLDEQTIGSVVFTALTTRPLLNGRFGYQAILRSECYNMFNRLSH